MLVQFEKKIGRKINFVICIGSLSHVLSTLRRTFVEAGSAGKRTDLGVKKLRKTSLVTE